jgi:hypothetical protein
MLSQSRDQFCDFAAKDCALLVESGWQTALFALEARVVGSKGMLVHSLAEHVLRVVLQFKHLAEAVGAGLGSTFGSTLDRLMRGGSSRKRQF